MQKYPSKKLILGTKALIRLRLFLRYECGLRYADKLSAKDFKLLLSVLKSSPVSREECYNKLK